MAQHRGPSQNKASGDTCYERLIKGRKAKHHHHPHQHKHKQQEEGGIEKTHILQASLSTCRPTSWHSEAASWQPLLVVVVRSGGRISREPGAALGRPAPGRAPTGVEGRPRPTTSQPRSRTALRDQQWRHWRRGGVGAHKTSVGKRGLRCRCRAK